MHRSGTKVHTFETFDDAARHWPWLRSLQVRANFHYPVLAIGNSIGNNTASYGECIHFDYVLRDEYDNIIHPDDINRRYRQLQWKPNRWFGYPNSRMAGAKRSHGHYFRKIKTTQERRWNGAWDDEEFAPKARAKRVGVNLPCDWDDLPRSDVDIRCWKRYRKTQWKA